MFLSKKFDYDKLEDNFVQISLRFFDMEYFFTKMFNFPSLGVGVRPLKIARFGFSDLYEIISKLWSI